MEQNLYQNTTILRVENLKMYFPIAKGFLKKEHSLLKAVDDISFEIQKGKTLGIVGESGCGKTTTGKCIVRIYQATSGKIYFKDKDILKMSDSEFKRYRRSMQMIFQDPYGSLDPRQTVFSSIKEFYLGDGKYYDKNKVKEKVEILMMNVGLPLELSNRYPHELSGGQRQRFGIARALACNPELIICDEPVSALDVSIQAQIINLFRKLQKETHLTFVFISHDLSVVRHISDVIAVMYLGCIVEIMDSAELFANPLHPYSKSLLSAIPVIDYEVEQQRKRIILKGEVPSPINKPSGCSFHPRCSYAAKECSEIIPELRDVGRGHYVACHNVIEK